MDRHDLRSYLERFHRGRAQAVKQEIVARELMVSPRQIQEWMVELLEHDSFIVCSSCTNPMGVYIPETLAEAESYMKQLRGRALNTLRHFNRVKRAVLRETAEIQEELFA